MTTAKTAAANLIAAATASERAARVKVAAANGMTVEQVAASDIVRNSVAVKASHECMAILRDRTKAMAALARVALIPETDAGSCYIAGALIVAAILAND